MPTVSRPHFTLALLLVCLAATFGLSDSAQAQFSEPIGLETATTTGTNPQIAVDSQGTAHVVWWHATGGSRVVRYASVTEGMASAPITISGAGLFIDNQQGPFVAVDGSGLVHIAWAASNMPDTSGPGPVQYATVANGVASAVFDVDTNSTRKPWIRMAVSAAGIAHLVWSDSNLDTQALQYRRIVNAEITDSYNLTGPASRVPHIRIAVGLDGSAHVVWRHKQEPAGNPPTNLEWDVRHASIAPDGSIASAAVVLGQTSVASNMPALYAPVVAVTDDGAGHVMWAQLVDNKWVLRYAAIGSGTSHQISPGGFDATALGIGVDNSGKVHLGWGLINEGIQLRHTVFSAGTVGNAISVFDGTFEVIDPDFAFDAAAAAGHYVWRGQFTQSFLVRHATADADSATASTPVSGLATILREKPEVAVDASGNAHVVWQEGPDGSNRQIRYAFDPGPGPIVFGDRFEM